MMDIVERALAAGRESRRVAIRASFDAASLVRDVAALANSGGGAIVVRAGDIAIRNLFDELHKRTDSEFADIHVERGIIVVGEAITPIVIDGVIFVRHGGKSVAATTDDLAKLIDRRVTMVRRAWLTAVRHVIQPEVPSSAESVRVVTDPRAPAFRLVDYDKTHPFRQKEVLRVLRERIPALHLTQFDILAIRKIHNVDANPGFVHKPAFGSNQYSVKFVDWLEGRIKADPQFIASAKEQYLRTRKEATSPATT